MGGKRDIVDAILGVLLPPVQVYRKTGKCGAEFWIDLILWLTIIGAILYCWHIHGLDLLVNIGCFFIPPLGLFCAKGNKCDQDVLICLVLTLFFWIPGMIFAYWKA